MSLLQMVVATDFIAQLRVIDHLFRQVPLNIDEPPAAEADRMDIRVVGVGTLGTNVVPLIARNGHGVWCHEIMRSGDGEPSSDLDLLLSSVRSCDLVFLIAGFDDDHCEAAAQVVGAAAVEAGVLTLVVTAPDTSPPSGDGPRWYDAIFNVSDHSLPDHAGSVPLIPTSLIRHAVRHVVTTITTLITHRTGICIDFADVKAIIQSGNLGRMGVGIGTDESRGLTAAMSAIDRLTAQGVDVASATGIFAAVHGSGDITMEDFDAVTKVIHDHASDDANIVVGLISDEQIGNNIKVTFLDVHR